MHIILFLVCAAMLFGTARTCLRGTTVVSPELVLISLASLSLAYPVKNLALYFLKDDFITFDFYGDASPVIYLHFMIFVGILWLVLSRVIDASAPPVGGNADRGSFGLRSVALLALLINSAMLFSTVSDITNGQLTQLLFTSDARKAFLINQQGQGWISLLIFFALPLTVLQSRTAIRNPLVIGCILLTFLTLSAVGSRLFLFGYAICCVMRFYRITPLIAGIMFSSFVLFGALIYISFAGTNAEDSAYHGLIYFMRTFDGADIMNGYFETLQPVYRGVTIVEDVLISYIPRAVWAAKPFNFGGIVITGDIYPELQDVQALSATYPPGLFLEGYANFSLLVPIYYFVIARFLVTLSSRQLHTNPYFFALYVSAAATSATIFRGFGQFLVALTAYCMIISVIFLIMLPIHGRSVGKSLGLKAARPT